MSLQRAWRGNSERSEDLLLISRDVTPVRVLFVQPIPVDVEARGRERSVFHARSHRGVHFSHQVRVDQAARHGLEVEPVAAFDQDGHARDVHDRDAGAVGADAAEQLLGQLERAADRPCR